MVKDTELKRYQRQMLIDGWGEETQEKLKTSTVFIAGAGGLGSPVALYLAVAGVGQIRLCDLDSPEWTNLNRQLLHDPSRIGINKAVSGKMTLDQLNPDVNVTAMTEKIVEENALRLIEGSAIVVDCMDNFPTRYVLDKAARELGIPLVHGAIRGMEGRVTVIRSPLTPCLRCMVPEAPPKEIFPVVGATPGVIGSIQAMETLKVLTGIGTPLLNKLLIWDGTLMEFSTYTIRKDPHCSSCGSSSSLPS